MKAITAEEIDTKLTAAIKQFGSYSYYDKGSHEVMDLGPIIVSLKKLTPEEAAALLTKLDKKKRNDRLVSDLVSELDSWKAFMSGNFSIVKQSY